MTLLQHPLSPMLSFAWVSAVAYTTPLSVSLPPFIFHICRKPLVASVVAAHSSSHGADETVVGAPAGVVVDTVNIFLAIEPSSSSRKAERYPGKLAFSRAPTIAHRYLLLLESIKSEAA